MTSASGNSASKAEKVQGKVHRKVQKEQVLELGVEKDLLREKMLIVRLKTR